MLHPKYLVRVPKIYISVPGTCTFTKIYILTNTLGMKRSSCYEWLKYKRNYRFSVSKKNTEVTKVLLCIVIIQLKVTDFNPFGRNFNKSKIINKFLNKYIPYFSKIVHTCFILVVGIDYSTSTKKTS